MMLNNYITKIKSRKKNVFLSQNIRYKFSNKGKTLKRLKNENEVN